MKLRCFRRRGDLECHTIVGYGFIDRNIAGIGWQRYLDHGIRICIAIRRVRICVALILNPIPSTNATKNNNSGNDDEDNDEFFGIHRAPS